LPLLFPVRGEPFFSCVVLLEVVSKVIGLPHELQVLKAVVASVFVDVVNLEPVWDWPVVLFPDSPVLELVNIPPRFIPSEHPVSVLLVPRRLFAALPFKVCTAFLAAIDSLVAGVTGL
jgi:hypothetical protein